MGRGLRVPAQDTTSPSYLAATGYSLPPGVFFVCYLFSTTIFFSAMPCHGPRGPMFALRIPHDVSQSLLRCTVRFQFSCAVSDLGSSLLHRALPWGPCSSAGVQADLLGTHVRWSACFAIALVMWVADMFPARLSGLSSACGELHGSFMPACTLCCMSQRRVRSLQRNLVQLALLGLNYAQRTCSRRSVFFAICGGVSCTLPPS